MQFDPSYAIYSFLGTLLTGVAVAAGHFFGSRHYSFRRLVVEYENIIHQGPALPILPAFERAIPGPSPQEPDQLFHDVQSDDEPETQVERLEESPLPSIAESFSPSRRPRSDVALLQAWLEIVSPVEFGVQTDVVQIVRSRDNEVQTFCRTQVIQTQTEQSTRESFVQAQDLTSDQSVQACELSREVSVQADIPDILDVPISLAEAQTQTEPQGAVGNWRRFVVYERRLAFLLRLRSSLTDFIFLYQGLYASAQ